MQTEIKPEGRINHCCVSDGRITHCIRELDLEGTRAIGHRVFALDQTAVPLVDLITNHYQQP